MRSNTSEADSWSIRFIFFLLFALAPILLSAAARCTFQCSFGLGLVIASLFTGAVFWYFARRTLDGIPLWAVSLAGLLSILAVAWLFRLLWNVDFGGAPNTAVGVDAGNHIQNFQSLEDDPHQIYGGFVGTYGIMHWFAHTFARRVPSSLAQFASLRAAYYATVLSVPAVFPIALLAALRGKPRKRMLAGLAAGVFLGAVALRWLLFPALSYYQTEGFYSQVAGIYPLVLLWLCWGWAASPQQRFVTLLFWLVLLRFTYGVNLPDIATAYALLYFWEQRKMPSRIWQLATWIFIPASIGVAVLVYRELFGMGAMLGYFTAAHYQWLIPAQLVGGLLLLSAPELLKAAGLILDEPVTRLARSAGAVASINGLMYFLYLVADQPMEYYFYKYHLYALVLLILGWTVVFAAVAATLDRAGWVTLWRIPALVFALTWLIFTALYKGLGPYEKAANQRAHDEPPYSALWSNYDPTADRFINELVSGHNSTFGGYYSPFWPRMYFMNVLHRVLLGNQILEDYRFHHWPQMFPLLKDQCYFWDMPVEDYKALPLQGQIEALNSSNGVECKTYRHKWSWKTSSVCGVCTESAIVVRPNHPLGPAPAPSPAPLKPVKNPARKRHARTPH